MKAWHILLVVSLLLACTTSWSQELGAEEEPARQGRTVSWNRLPEDYPLVFTDNSGIDIGVIKDHEFRKRQVKLKNRSGQPVVIRRVISTCPCLTIHGKLPAGGVLPGEEMTIEFTIDARQLKPGDFEREFYIIVKDFQRIRVPVTGFISTMVSYAPKQVIDLGDFLGAYPFTRSFELTSKFEKDELEFGPIAENKLFNFKFEKIDVKKYRLTVTPKLPLPKGRFREVVKIPITNVQNYDSWEVGIMGIVMDPFFILKRNIHTISQEEVAAGKENTVEFEILQKDLVNGGKQLSWGHGRINTEKVEVMPVTVDEYDLGIWEDVKTWEKYAKEIVVDGLPSALKYQVKPHAKGITVSVAFPAGYCKEHKGGLAPLMVRFNKKLIGKMRIMWR